MCGWVAFGAASFFIHMQALRVHCLLPQEQKQKLADALETMHFEHGQRLFAGGEAGDRCFLLRSGAVQVVGAGGEVLRRVEKGGCLGERALIADTIRSALAMRPYEARWQGMSESEC